jgi:hypothetical protein
MLYLCIPVHNEAATVGLLLWKIRAVFQQYSREYEIIAYDDGSADATRETLAGYTEVLPLVVLGSRERVGYGRALEACCREVDSRSRYPRRDALLIIQGDFTEAPEHIPELVRRFEGGADVVTGERTTVAGMPRAVRRLRRLGRWLIGRRAPALGTSDPLSGFRLYRVAVIRELLKQAGNARLVTSDNTAGDVELLLAAARVARRLESVSTTPRYDLRQRPSRLRSATKALAVFRLSRAARRTGGRAPMKAALALSAFLLVTGSAAAVGISHVSPPVARLERVPFGPGERLVFDVRFSAVRVGSSTMEVRGITPIRGRPAYHTVFTLRGGTFFYRVNDVLQSWIDTSTLASLRFVQDLEEGSRDRERRYEIYPDRRVYVEATADDTSEQPSVDLPLDDASFLYFMRTVPLVVGQSYEFHRYFRPDRNPVRIHVVRRERVRVPAGTFDAVVVRPTIRTRGIFAEGGRAELWISDDDRRLILQLRSRLSFGSINLFLRSYTPPTANR